MSIATSTSRLILALGISVAAAVGAWSADPPAAKKQAASKTAGAPADAFFKLPSGGAAALIKFIDKLKAEAPADEEPLKAYLQKATPAYMLAAAKLRKVATKRDRESAEICAALDEAILFESNRAIELTREEQKRLLADLAAQFATEETPSKDLLEAMQNLPRNLERSGKTDEAATIFRELGGKLAHSDYPQLAETGIKMIGAARRLSLVGKPLELAGTQVDGSPFRLADLKGKVVLVDFWATWCAPCLAELPNVKKIYAAYHDRGFEVVGVSLDGKRNDLLNFLVKTPVPWVTLHDGDWSVNDVATYYGIMSIPTVFLVDKTGKVVSLTARGEHLDHELEKLLGPAE